MPSTTPSTDPKVRQSSGGKSFFGRKLYKERSAESRIFEDGPLSPGGNSGANSSAGSKSSRHSHKPSDSIDMDDGADGSYLSQTAGVITSIPYESLSINSKTPIPVDYLPRNDQVPARKEPLPHHLNKGGGDFHQYPSWDPPQRQTITGPRPPPHTSQLPSSASGRNQQSGRPLTSTSNTNGFNNTFYTNTSTDSSTGRKSFDQASIYSTVSSNTRGSSIFSSDNSSRTAIPSHVQDQSPRPGSSHSPARQSTASALGWHPHPQTSSFATSTSFNPDGFHLPRPTDEHVIEAQFIALMHKRGWQNLPDQARRQMMAYPAAKKWTLVHQDKLTEWQGEQKRRQHARQTINGADGYGALQRADEEGSPEWYVKRVLDDSINAKQLQSLSVSLRTQPIRYVCHSLILSFLPCSYSKVGVVCLIGKHAASQSFLGNP